MPSLTYAELAEVLKIMPASANRLARRRRWPRLMGNDGRARVSVPDEALVRQDSPPDVPPVSPPDATAPPVQGGGDLEGGPGARRELRPRANSTSVPPELSVTPAPVSFTVRPYAATALEMVTS